MAQSPVVGLLVAQLDTPVEERDGVVVCVLELDGCWQHSWLPGGSGFQGFRAEVQELLASKAQMMMVIEGRSSTDYEEQVRDKRTVQNDSSMGHTDETWWQPF